VDTPNKKVSGYNQQAKDEVLSLFLLPFLCSCRPSCIGASGTNNSECHTDLAQLAT